VDGIPWVSSGAGVPLRLLLPSPDYEMESRGSLEGRSQNDALLYEIFSFSVLKAF